MNLKNLVQKSHIRLAATLASLALCSPLVAQQSVDFSSYTTTHSFTTGDEIADSAGEFAVHFGRPDWATAGTASASVDDLGDGNRLLINTAEHNNAFAYVDGPAFDPTAGSEVIVRSATFRIATAGTGRAYLGLYAGAVKVAGGHDFRDLGDATQADRAAAGLGLVMLGNTFRVVRTGPANTVQYWTKNTGAWADGSSPSGATYAEGKTYTATALVDPATGALTLTVVDEDAGGSTVLSANSSLADTGSQGTDGGLHLVFGEASRNNGHSWAFEVSELQASSEAGAGDDSTVLDFSDYTAPYTPANGEAISGSEDGLIANYGRRADLTTGSGSTDIEDSGDGNHLLLQTADHNGAYAYLSSPVFDTSTSKVFGANFRFTAIGNSRAFFGLYNGAIASTTGYDFRKLGDAGADTHIGIGLVFHGSALRIVRTGPDNTIQTWIASSSSWVDGYTNSGPSYAANVDYTVSASLNGDTGELRLSIAQANSDSPLLSATSNLSETGSQGASGGLHLVFGEPCYNTATDWTLDLSELSLGNTPPAGDNGSGGDDGNGDDDGDDDGSDDTGGVTPSDPALYAKGFINVLDYGADGSDDLDDTAAIQAAVNDAYSDSVAESRAVYFPDGTYLISDTIEVRRPSTADMTAWRPSNMLIGAKERPVFLLSDEAQGFDDPANPKPMFFILGERRGHPGEERQADHFNTLFRNFVLDTGVGHSGAIGLDFAGAEGCSINNITILSSDPDSTFFAGATGIPGSGGSVIGFEVLGGSYGLYCPQFDTAGTGTLVAASRFIGQTESAIFYNCFTPITLVGFEIQKESGPVFQFASSGHETSANPSIIDGTIELTAATDGIGSVVVSHKSRNVLLRNVYVKGASSIVAENSGNTDFTPFVSDDPSEWRWVENYAEGPRYTFEFDGVVYGGKLIDGVFQDEADQVPLVAREPSIDYIAKHLWEEDFATFDRPEVIDVKDAPYNATGDGVTDDTAAIQAAIDAGSAAGVPVFLSHGRFVVTSPIQLHSNTEFFGISRSVSILDGRTMQSSAIGGLGPAIVRSDDSADSKCAISDIKIMIPASGQGISGIYWQAGRDSIARDIWTNRDFGGPQDNAPGIRGIITGNGGGRFYNWLCQSGFDTDNQGSRNFVIDGTHEPLRFYMLHNQHMKNPYGIRFEVRNSANIAIYSAKHEDNGNDGRPVPFSFTNVDNVQIFGVTGLGKPYVGRASVEFHDSSNYSLANIGTWAWGQGTPEKPHYYAQEYFNGEIEAQVFASNQLFLNELRRGHPDYTTGDHVEPTVFLTSPSEGTVIEAGESVGLSAEARDSQEISLVEFYSDLEDFIADDDTAPFEGSWTPQTVGTHLLNALAYDADAPYSVAASNIIEVLVQDTTAPVIESLVATPDKLWPANRRMRQIAIQATGSDAGGPVTFNILGVTANESIDDPVEGVRRPDWRITGPLALELRAERSNPRKGRVYTIEVEAVDASGNRTTETVKVNVPSTREVLNEIIERIKAYLEWLRSRRG